MRRTDARNRIHHAKRVIQHIAPVAEHVDDDAAVQFLFVIPGGPLARLPVAFEDPVAKLAAHGKNLAEESGIHEPAQFAHAWEKQLILHNALLDSRTRSLRRQLQ